MSKIRIVQRGNVYIIQKLTDVIFGLWPHWVDWDAAHYSIKEFQTLAEAERYVSEMLNPVRDVVVREFCEVVA